MTTLPESTTEKLPFPSVKPVSLRRNFAWTFVGNMVYAGSSWGMLVVLAKMGSPVAVGQFALGLALTAPVILLASLQLRSIQATDSGYEYRFSDYLGLRLVMLVAALLTILGIVSISAYERELALTILVIALGKAVDAISDIIYGLLQQQEQMDRISVSLILKGILSLLLLALGQYLTDSILWASVGWTLASILIFLLYDLPSGKLILKSFSGERPDSIYPRFQSATLAKLLWLALPLGITLMLISLNTSIPRYVIEHYQGVRELGFYSAIAYVTVIGTTVTNSLGQAATPRLAKYYAAKDVRLFLALLLRLMGIAVVLCTASIALVMVAGKTILTLLYQPEYAVYTDIFLLLIVATGMSYIASFLGYAMTAARYFRAQIVLFGVVTAATALGSLFWIPEHGILGGAWAVISAGVIQIIGSLAINIYAIYKIRVAP